MPQEGFWSSHCWSEAPSSYYQRWSSGLVSYHESPSPESDQDNDQINHNKRIFCLSCLYHGFILKSVSDCRSHPTSLSTQSHRDTAVVGLVGWIRRNFRGMMLLLSSLRAARRCSFLFTAGSSPWRYYYISTDATRTMIWIHVQLPEACSNRHIHWVLRMTRQSTQSISSSFFYVRELQMSHKSVR